MTFEMPKLPSLANVYHQRAVSFQVFERLTLLSHVSQTLQTYPWNIVTGEQQLEIQFVENTKISFICQKFPKSLF